MSVDRPSSFSRNRANAGFTLFEALVSVALMGLIVISLSVVTGQWLPSWHRGFGRVQRVEALDVGLQRIVEDLEAAEFVALGGESKHPFFVGDHDSVTLVRAATGPNANPHLEFVRLAETVDARGPALARARAPFAPRGSDATTAQPRFVEPLALIRAPFRVSFAFAGPDRLWRDTWRDEPLLPTAVLVEIRDSGSGEILSLSTATLLNVDLPAACVGQKSVRQCLAGIDAPADDQAVAPYRSDRQ